ncbi:hypothetical protein F7725_015521 [Dissostichus mawsoni]|uniref:Nucleoporin Nup159/Nup146 N-terminal domain-containing protein n=1 Tax=Dissostichus mawsoni TaxID=36200 RepID=A0A7J5YHT4_DISMA|nr:hypothetical protein F7725_015521 [Dissostichus mawsoni]
MSDDTDNPPEREMKDFQFRQMKKTRVFQPTEDLPKERTSLLTISNKFGLTFVGLDRTFKVYQTQDILGADKFDGNPNEVVEGTPVLADVTVDLSLHHLALSSDELTLSVCGISEAGGLSFTFYDVRTFMNKARTQKLPFASLLPAVAPGSLVQDLKWNPVQPSMLAVCLSDGCLMILDVTGDVKVQAQLPASNGITCSTRGKRNIPCPNFYTSDPVKDGSLETPPELVLISLPIIPPHGHNNKKKDERTEAKYLNFSDTVDLLFAASAASIEVGVIAARQEDKNWELWILEDASRAELPVTETSEDTLPLGLAIDYTSQQAIYITDEKTLPPAPTMLMLSTEGILCPFALLNLNPGVKQLVAPPSVLALDGERPPMPGALAAQPPKVAASIPSASIPSAPATFPNLSFPPASAPAPLAPAAAPSAAPFSVAPTSRVLGIIVQLRFLGPNYLRLLCSSSFLRGDNRTFWLRTLQLLLSLPNLPLTLPQHLQPFLSHHPSNQQRWHLHFQLRHPRVLLLPPRQQFTALETPAPSPQSFSFNPSMPKPVTPISSSLTAPPPSAAKPPAVMVRPVQISTPPTVVQKPAPAPAPAPAAQGRVQTPQIAHFQKELDDLKTRSSRADFKVGTNDEMKELRKGQRTSYFTLEIKETQR